MKNPPQNIKLKGIIYVTVVFSDTVDQMLNITLKNELGKYNFRD